MPRGAADSSSSCVGRTRPIGPWAGIVSDVPEQPLPGGRAGMKYGVGLPNFGDCFDPRGLATMAHEAEAAGWDGFFLWDHVQFMPTPTVDPWVALAAIALSTQRIRGAMLDEGLHLLTRLWSGEPLVHDGRFYRFRGDFGPGRPEVNPTPMLPHPVQSPRIPVWVAGTWPKKPPFRRAARWDGVVPLADDGRFGRGPTPAAVRDILAYVGHHRTSETAFDVVIGGPTAGADRGSDRAKVEPYAEGRAAWGV